MASCGAAQPRLLLRRQQGADVKGQLDAAQLVQRVQDGGHRRAVVKGLARDDVAQQLGRTLAQRDKISRGEDLLCRFSTIAHVDTKRIERRRLLAVFLGGEMRRYGADNAIVVPILCMHRHLRCQDGAAVDAGQAVEGQKSVLPHAGDDHGDLVHVGVEEKRGRVFVVAVTDGQHIVQRICHNLVAIGFKQRLDRVHRAVLHAGACSFGRQIKEHLF